MIGLVVVMKMMSCWNMSDTMKEANSQEACNVNQKVDGIMTAV